MHVVIEGRDLPGRTFCRPDGSPLNDVHVGIQIRKDPHGLTPGDSASARWEVDIEAATTDDGEIDFRGPAVHGKRGDRFLYLVWGNVDDDGEFEMYRRAKLMLNRIHADLLKEATAGETLVGKIQLRDGSGHPRCARVDPPDLEWSLR